MRIKVPASSGNLGPGFDCFGIAWKLYDEIEFTPSGKDFEVEGCPEVYRGRDNLCLSGYAAARRRRKLPEEPLRVNFLRNDIPISRGLGSSAALIVAGAVAANHLCHLNLSKEELLEAASEAEGHPDNVAPVLFGGFTACASENEAIKCVRLNLCDRIHFTALVPDFGLSTKLARSILPEKVPFSDAVYNLSHCALLIKAMETGNPQLLSSAMKDRLHQSYRADLIKGYKPVKELALSLGAEAVCISGAGPTLLCISDSADFSEKIKTRLAQIFPKWRVIPLFPDYEGAKVL